MEQPIFSERQQQAKALFEAGYNCSQSVAGAFWQAMGLPQATVLATVTGFGGGFARLREVCGAVSGMVAVISAVQQRSGVTPEGKKENYPLIQQYVKAFEAHFGSYLCRELLGLRARERESPQPSLRTPEWYTQRPCLHTVLYAVQLTEQALAQLQATATQPLQPSAGISLDRAYCTAHRPVRPVTGHKGSFGRVVALCGCTAYRGAAVLACTGALRAGAGLVTLAAPEPVCAAVAAHRPEVTFCPLDTPKGDSHCSAAVGVGNRSNAGNNVTTADDCAALAQAALPATVLLAGCGLGRTELAAARLLALLRLAAEKNIPTVLDADGLYFLPQLAPQPTVLPPLVLTPHIGEAARLLSWDSGRIAAEQPAAARALAVRYGAVAVLKGSTTWLAAPDGTLAQLNAPNDGLATGGSGDLLAGIIAGLAAQAVAPLTAAGQSLSRAVLTAKLWDAAACGVWLHSDAAAHAAQKRSTAALLPTDIAEEIR